MLYAKCTFSPFQTPGFQNFGARIPRSCHLASLAISLNLIGVVSHFTEIHLFSVCRILHGIYFNNLLVSYSESIQESINLITCRKFSMFLSRPRKLNTFSTRVQRIVKDNFKTYGSIGSERKNIYFVVAMCWTHWLNINQNGVSEYKSHNSCYLSLWKLVASWLHVRDGSLFTPREGLKRNYFDL